LPPELRRKNTMKIPMKTARQISLLVTAGLLFVAPAPVAAIGKGPMIGPLTKKQDTRQKRAQLRRADLQQNLRAAKAIVRRGKATLRDHAKKYQKSLMDVKYARALVDTSVQSYLENDKLHKSFPTEKNRQAAENAAHAAKLAAYNLTQAQKTSAQAKQRFEQTRGQLQQGLTGLRTAIDAIKRGPPAVGRPTYAPAARIAAGAAQSQYSVHPQGSLASLMGPLPTPPATRGRAGSDAASNGPLPPLPVKPALLRSPSFGPNRPAPVFGSLVRQNSVKFSILTPD
jgi:hypothetical protein